MVQPVLPDDIYCLIAEELDWRSDVSAFMRCSRSCYSAGINPLLRMGVFIYSDDELVAFCLFMKRNFLDLGKNTNQVHELTLSFDWDEDEYDSDEDELSDYDHIDTLNGAPLLVPALGCLVDLRSLTMEYCETLLKSDDRLVGAFTALTTLRELHIVGFGLLTYDVVSALRSNLSTVSVDCGYLLDGYPIVHDANCDMVDPLHTLRRYRETLQEATIHLADVTQALLKQEPRSTDYVFPCVHTLALSRCRAVERRTIRNAFPNVRALDLFWLVCSYQGIELTIDAARSLNVADTRQWTALDHVYADIESMYMLALRCPINRLDLVCWQYDTASLHYLLTAIAETRPPRLLLQLGYWETHHNHIDARMSPEWLGHFLASRAPAVARNITHFGLDVGHVTYRDPFRRKDGITQLLARLPSVRIFTFRLHAVGPQDEDEYDCAAFVDALGVLMGFDEEGLRLWASQIARVAPSLELMCFSIMDRCVFWRVSRKDGGRWIDRIEAEDGERLMADEGMQPHYPSKAMWPGPRDLLTDD